MARARQLSKGLQTAAIMKHVRNAIKGAEYRQYKTHAEDRLAEFTRMVPVDLDSEDPSVRDPEAAFGADLPTLVLQAQHVASVFSQQLDEDLVLSGYLAMVQHYLPEAKPLDMLLRSRQFCFWITNLLCHSRGAGMRQAWWTQQSWCNR